MERVDKRAGSLGTMAVCLAAVLLASCSSGSNGSTGSSGSIGSNGSVAPGSSVPASGARTGEFTALTYNVAGLPQGLSGSNPTEYMPLIGPKLNDYDLVLSQEDFATPNPNPLPVGFFHEVLLATTSHPYRPSAMIPPVGTNPDRPTAIAGDGLNMFSKFPVGPVTRRAWTKCFGGADTKDGGAADCLAMKGFTVATVTLADGVVIDVYNLHGEAGSTPVDLDASAADYRELAEYINANSKDHAILLGGDTNLSTGGNEADIAVWNTFLAATGLKDVCRTITCATDPEDIDKFAFKSSSSITLEPLERKVELEKFEAPGKPELNEGQLSDHEAVSSRWRWTVA